MAELPYRPMRNDRRDFDPLGDQWSYILDMYPGPGWRQLVPVRCRRAAWPFDRTFRFQAIRLDPDWCRYAWHPYTVLAWPGHDDSRDAGDTDMHLVSARMWFEPRDERGIQSGQWTGIARLNLATGERYWQPGGLNQYQPLPEAIAAEVDHRCGKLTAFFEAAIEQWRAGAGQPVTAAAYLTETEHTHG